MDDDYNNGKTYSGTKNNPFQNYFDVVRKTKHPLIWLSWWDGVGITTEFQYSMKKYGNCGHVPSSHRTNNPLGMQEPRGGQTVQALY
jgi:hypothetical protein